MRAALATVLVGLAILPAGAGATTRPNIGSFGSFQNPQNVAVDQSNGDIYVLDVGAKTVSRFDSSFATKSFTALNTNVIDGTATLACTGSPSPNCDQVPFNGFSFSATVATAQVAIDNSGSPLTNGQIYVTDPVHRLIDVFAPSGAYVGSLSQTGSAGVAFGEVCGVAVDSNGAVYVGDVGKSRIHKFVPTSAVPANSDFVADFTSTQPCELAAGAGPTAGALFVSRRNGAVTKLSSAGTLLYTVAAGSTRGVAVDPTTGNVFVPLAESVSERDASGPAPLTLGAFGAQQLANAGGAAVDGSRGRVYVSEANGKVFVYGSPTAETKPAVSLGPYVARSRSSVGLVGYVDPHEIASTYYFEYGTADCATSACTRLPGPSGVAVARGVGPQRVAQQVTGLVPATTYHYRLVASNAVGTTAGADATFTTLATPLDPSCANSSRREEQQLERLPDCRAYELVSAIPADRRNGMEVLVNSQRAQAATSGNAFGFSSLGGTAETNGIATAAEYVSARSPLGWSVHPITPQPPQKYPPFALAEREPRYVGDFAPDLSKAVFLSGSPLTDEGPNVQEVFNLYRREDLLTPGLGAYRLLTDSVVPQSPPASGQPSEEGQIPAIVGVSSDLSQVVFESRRNLTASAAGLAAGLRLYKWARGAISLVGILPASEGGGPSISKAGRGAIELYAPHAVSSDGSRVLFTAPPFNSDGTGGKLYLRDDQGTAETADDTTVKVNASEKTNGAGPGGIDPGGVKPASFWDATPDTTRLFFTSAEALTDDAPTDAPSVSKLYRYDLGAPAGDRLTLLSVDGNAGDGIGAGAEGVIGTSEDGSYVYFVGTNQLVPGLSIAAGPRVFVWHAGTVEQVAAINGGNEQKMILGSGKWREDGTRWSRVSADGRHLLFVSEGTEELAGYNHGTTCPADASTRCRQVYFYSVADADGGGRLSCASCRAGSEVPAGDAELSSRDAGSFIKFLLGGSSHLSQALSSDGSIFFNSQDRLSPFDANQSSDVYEFDPATGRISLLSGGMPEAASYFLDASDDGSDVFFATRSRLLAADGNDYVDVYDARVGGGFATPTSPGPIACESADSCRPAPGGSLPAVAPESARLLPRTGHSHKRRPAHKKKHRRRQHERRSQGQAR